jgi:aminoglycoside phosphotransferase
MPQTLAPDDIVRSPEEGAANARVPLLVLDPLEAFLDEHGLGAGPVAVEPVGEGHSNVTFVLERGGERFVLRRPPRPPLPPSAHDVLREARVLSALAPTPVRTPEVLAVCADEAVIGSPFYVMELVEGDVITERVPAALDDPEGRRRIGEELVDALVELHAVDWRAVGLEGFGKPTGYLERQVRRFLGLWDHNRTREIEAVERVAGWLQANLPESPEATVVHGDFRLGNTMYAAGAPRAADRDLRLGDGHDRRPAGGRRLPVHDVERGRRPAGRHWPIARVTRAEGLPDPGRARRRVTRRARTLHDRHPLVHGPGHVKAVVFMEGNYRRAWPAPPTIPS